MDRRKIEEMAMKILMLFSLTIVIGSLLLIIAIIIFKGGPALNWEMVSQTPQGGYYIGKGGGILNAIVGSLYLAAGGTIMAFFVSLGTAMYLQREFVGRSKFAEYTRMSLDVLWGVPSIVYGVFILAIMVTFEQSTSLFCGMIVLALVEIPIITRTMDESLKMVPSHLKEASFSLGSTKFETIKNIASRQALPGIVSGILLAFGRAIGDGASILLVAGYSDNIPSSFSDPTASLPLAVLFQLGTPYPEVQQRAYASAFILLMIVLIISISSRLISRRFMKFVIK